MPGIRAVDVAGCSIIQRAACLLNHLVVHDLVIGRVRTHLEFVDLPMVATAVRHHSRHLVAPLQTTLDRVQSSSRLNITTTMTMMEIKTL